MTTSTIPTTSWMKGRDDYGRTVHHLYRLSDGACLGVAVRLPRVWIEQHGPEQTYLVNNWTIQDRDHPDKVNYFRTLPNAKAFLEWVTR
jgi:hypothetical protein